MFLVSDDDFTSLVAELNNDRKKSQKAAKPKAASEGRKDLTGVRVIQRNLVYVMSLPFDLADEDVTFLLWHFIYFLERKSLFFPLVNLRFIICKSSVFRGESTLVNMGKW